MDRKAELGIAEAAAVAARLAELRHFPWPAELPAEPSCADNPLWTLRTRPGCRSEFVPLRPFVLAPCSACFARTLSLAKGDAAVRAGTSGGMLIRRRVLEGMERPYFAAELSHDVDFCVKAREAGFEVYCDLDLPMAHIACRCRTRSPTPRVTRPSRSRTPATR